MKVCVFLLGIGLFMVGVEYLLFGVFGSKTAREEVPNVENVKVNGLTVWFAVVCMGIYLIFF